MDTVKDCLQWEQMSGQSSIEKKINSYMTFCLVDRFDVPSDECLSYAKRISNLSGPVTADSIIKVFETSFVEAFEREKLLALAHGIRALLVCERKAD